MTEESRDSSTRLSPARLPDGGRTPFGPKIPWKIIVPVLLGVAGLIAVFWYRSEQEILKLRATIVSVYEEPPLSVAVADTRAFQNQIEQWVMSAIEAGEEDAPPQVLDPRLRISGLHSGQGLYLRVIASDVASTADVETSAMFMIPDAVTRCLGIAPASLRGLYQHGGFLMPAWIEDVKAETSAARLTVLQTAFQGHLDRDLPAIVNLLESDYFLLLVQRGPSRRDAPVDVFLWNLRAGHLEDSELVLRTRTQANGVLIPVAIHTENAPRYPTPRVDSPGAADCSIAAQIKELTGEPALSIRSEIPRDAEVSDEETDDVADDETAEDGEPTPAAELDAPAGDES